MTDITAVGELLIDFTEAGLGENGRRLFEQNPGGAPANLLTLAARLGFHTAFAGKVGRDMHGIYLKSVLEREGIDTRGLVCPTKRLRRLLLSLFRKRESVLFLRTQAGCGYAASQRRASARTAARYTHSALRFSFAHRRACAQRDSFRGRDRKAQRRADLL